MNWFKISQNLIPGNEEPVQPIIEDVDVVDQIPRNNMAPPVDDTVNTEEPIQEEQPQLPGIGEMPIEQEEMSIEQNLPKENPINQKIVEIPDSRLEYFIKRMARINKKADKAHQPHLEFEVIPKPPEPAYDKEIKLPNGSSVYMPARTIRIKGEIPIPKGIIPRTLRDDNRQPLRDTNGQIITQDFMYKIVGEIENFLPVEPPKKVQTNQAGQPWDSVNEVQQWISQQDEPSLWVVYKGNTDFGTNKLVAYYLGKWKNKVVPTSNVPLDPRFDQMPPALCEHCMNIRERVKGFVVVEFDPKKLNGRDPSPQEVAQGKQILMGSGCLSGQLDELAFVNSIKKFKIQANEEIDANNVTLNKQFGGGWRSWPKNFIEVLSNAIEMKKRKGMLRTSTLGYYYSTWDPNATRVVPWGQPSPESVQKAKEIKDWWKSRDNEPGLDRTDKNIANMSHQETLGMNNFYILNRMIGEYDSAHVSPEEKARQEAEKLEQQRLMEQREEQRRLRIQQEEQERGQVDDVPAAGIGQSFRAKFQFLSSVRKDGRYGTYYLVTFKDRSGNKYATFNKTNFNATPNSVVTIEATMGEKDRRYGTTKLTKVKLLGEVPAQAEQPAQPAQPAIGAPAQEAGGDISQIGVGDDFKMRVRYTGSEMKNTRRGEPVAPYYLNKFEDSLGHKLYNFSTEEFNAGVGAEVFVSGTKVRYNRVYGNQVKNLKITEEAAPTQPTEAPVGNAPTILDEEPVAPPVEPKAPVEEKPKTSMELAKSFGEELKKRVTTRDMSKRISVEEALPIYLKSLKNIKPSFDADAWAISLKRMYETNGQEYLFKMIDRMPGMFA